MIIANIPTGIAYIDINIFLPFSDFKIHVTTMLDEVLSDFYRIPMEPYFHLIFYKDGEFEYVFNDEIHQIEPETFVLYSSRHIHIENALNKKIKKYHVIFTALPKKGSFTEKNMKYYHEESKYMCDYLLQEDFFTIQKDDTGETASILERIISEFNTMRFGYHHIISSLMTVLFTTFFRNIKKTRYSLPKYAEPQTQLLLSNAISNHIQHNYKTITLKEIADSFHMSERQIQRYVFKLFQTSFTQRLNFIRIEKAKALLKETNWAISIIAEEVGFVAPSYFYKLFKKLQNTTPSQYRKNSYTANK